MTRCDRPNRMTLVRVLLAVLTCVLCTGIFFHTQIANGFSVLSGDIVDARIEIALLEHWWNVFRGLEAWRQPLYFYPSPTILGYNDGYFIFGAVYSIFRTFRLDPFLATELVNVATRVIAFGAFLGFARRACGLPFYWSLVGAAAFTLCNAAYMQTSHAQLLSLAFAPLFAWMAWAAAAALQRKAAMTAAIWGCAAALFFDAWLMTAFYMAWFLAFFTLLLVLVLAVMALSGRLPGWRDWLHVPRWPVLATGVAFVAGLVPFVMTYLQSARATGMHSLAEALAIAPQPLDFVNVGAHNLFFGPLNVWVTQMLRPGADLRGEHAVGMPLIGLSLSLWAVVVAWRSPPAPGRAAWRAVSAALILSIAISVEINHVTLWRYVFEAVPGAAAIRVICRYVLFLNFPVILLALYGLSRTSPRWPAALAAVAGGLLVAEQINLEPLGRLYRNTERQFLATVPAPPASCKAFIVTAPRTVGEPESDAYLQPLVVDTDAMLLAELLHLPTLNGHASFLPASFNLTYTSTSSDFATARRYISDLGLDPVVCGLNLETASWQPAPLPPSPAAPLPFGVTLDFGQPGAQSELYLPYGWSGAEPAGRWTDGSVAEFAFRVPSRDRAVIVSMQASGVEFGGPPGLVRISIEGHALAEWTPAVQKNTLRVTIPAAFIPPSGDIHVRLAESKPLRPKDYYTTSADDRRLGLFVRSATITQANAAESGTP